MSLLDLDSDDFCKDAPLARSLAVDIADIPSDQLDWAEYTAFINHQKVCEGANFVRISDSVELIGVKGGQFMHHDRHMSGDDVATSPINNTWNLVIYTEGSQFLLTAVDHNVFEHFAIEPGAFIFMSTINQHALSRKSANDFCILVQAEGFGPDQPDQALAAIRTALAIRTIVNREDFRS